MIAPNLHHLLTRRRFLSHTSAGLGMAAVASLLGESASAQGGRTHFAPRAKLVIFLTMRGGPSHVDTFDYKPKLIEDTDKPGKRPGTKLLGSKWKFSQSGKSGLYISELFPNVAKHADEL